MTKTSMISTRVNPELKGKVEAVLAELGLTTTQAITLFLKQVELQHGLPFQVKIPNAETRQAIEDSRNIDELGKADSSSELYEDMGI